MAAEIMWMYWWLSVKQDWKCLGRVNYVEDAQLPNGNLLTTRTILETMLILPWPQHHGMCIKGLKLISLILWHCLWNNIGCFAIYTVSTRKKHILNLYEQFTNLIDALYVPISKAIKLVSNLTRIHASARIHQSENIMKQFID